MERCAECRSQNIELRYLGTLLCKACWDRIANDEEGSPANGNHPASVRDTQGLAAPASE